MKRALLSVLAFAACDSAPPGGDDGGDDGGGAVGPFDDGVTQIRIEIDYEVDRAPYTGPVLGFGDTFDLSRANLERLFSGTRDLELPATLDAMAAIGAVADEELTVDDLLALAETHRDLADAADTKTYYVVFVSGQFADADGVQPSVLGVSLGDTGVVAMFKDVIESTGVPTFPNLERFVEQSVLIHELGHAIGLVDTGVPMVADHLDDPHGAHCTSDQCVMYWLNEGASDMAAFARDYVLTGDSILFDPACLADVDALTP